MFKRLNALFARIFRPWQPDPVVDVSYQQEFEEIIKANYPRNVARSSSTLPVIAPKWPVR